MKKNNKQKPKKGAHLEDEKDDKDKSVREHYVDMGVKQYYEQHGGEYINPHEERVRGVLKDILKNWDINTSRVLDLACGSGEVTLALRDLGVTDITGVDPYTYAGFEKRTGLPCLPISFEDIANGKLSEEKYSLIICSYALHLAKLELLPVLAIQMSMISEQLLIITPHKRPDIEEKWGWIFKNEVVIERTRARLYTSSFFQ